MQSPDPRELSPRQVEREFRLRVADGLRIRPSGSARRDPEGLLSSGYTPKFRVDLFDTTFYLTRVRQNEDLRFFVAYVVQSDREAFPRLFYKDVSLIWRAASHYVLADGAIWIGKGDVTVVADSDDEEIVTSLESTTDLPLELQPALESLSRRSSRIPYDDVAVDLVLRRGPRNRTEAYPDFTRPRRSAQREPENLINGGRSIAFFRRPGDPSSIEFAAGFAPDFARGVLESGSSTSVLYGGELRRFRILSANRCVQYLFMAGPGHAWIIPAQATTTELTSFGVRSIDVVADEDLFIPGFEYHFVDEDADPPRLVSQIPEGFVGEPNEFDASRADASPWLERLPVIQEFREKVLARSRRPNDHD